MLTILKTVSRQYFCSHLSIEIKKRIFKLSEKFPFVVSVIIDVIINDALPLPECSNIPKFFYNDSRAVPEGPLNSFLLTLELRNWKLRNMIFSGQLYSKSCRDGQQIENHINPIP